MVDAHQRAIELMRQAQSTTNEGQANALIAQAQAAAQQVSGTVKGGGSKAAVVFEAVTRHAQQIQARNVALRPAASPPPSSGGGGQQSSPTTHTPAPPPAKPPDPWTRSSNYKPPTGIKQADPDIVLFDSESISPEFLLELQYEDIAGMELINISRSDIIDGQDVVYSPVKNLSSIRRRYNPNNIISLPELSDSFFSRFGIDLLQRGMNDPYFDEEGNLVIEVDNVKDGEVIEVEIDTNGTIEEVEFL